MPSAGHRSSARRHNSPERHDSPSSEINNLQLSNEFESSAEVPLDNEDDIPVNTALEEDILESVENRQTSSLQSMTAVEEASRSRISETPKVQGLIYSHIGRESLAEESFPPDPAETSWNAADDAFFDAPINPPVYLPCGFEFKPVASTVDDVIKAAKTTGINIGDYSSSSFRLRPESAEGLLQQFQPDRWLTDEVIMTVISLFSWPESTLVLHTNHMANIDNEEIWNNKLSGQSWPLEPHHTELMIPYCNSHHWMLIQVDILAQQIRCYDSLKGCIQGDRYIQFVQRQLKRMSISDTFSHNHSEEVWRKDLIVVLANTA